MLESVKEFKKEDEIVHIINAIEVFCAGAATWCTWWKQPHILKLLLAKSSQENDIPRHTNHQEILNVNVPTYGGNYVIESEMLLREDMLALIRYLSLCSGVELSYRNTTKQGREKRNLSRKQAQFDSRPADTVARGIVPTNVSTISVIKNFVQGVEEMERKKLDDFAGEQADDLNDKDFTPTGSVEPAKQKRTPRTPKKGVKRAAKPSPSQTKKKSKVIEDEYSSSSSDGFESAASNSITDESESESDSIRDTEIFTRSKGLIGDPNRSESA
ncbi:predicted protein [Naegleria gruberi]|uniref:Predicted protein n=1 Tax=Naegleria gruberi TaxID=5762 RepID=D2W0V3_NAEGR|nr:uncharacterized protein NAEGRDRAFT_74992 [Naegleria gruberi]EFC37207.1 predicted protein [Naegleria gruberi]|eukprot:XP_002669951.1 predicted protein [Naegleria gruberi strain NEG-M]